MDYRNRETGTVNTAYQDHVAGLASSNNLGVPDLVRGRIIGAVERLRKINHALSDRLGEIEQNLDRLLGSRPMPTEASSETPPPSSVADELDLAVGHLGQRAEWASQLLSRIAEL